MSEIVNTATIKVVADASGVEAGLRSVDDAVVKTGKNLENLGATAKSTGKLIEDAGRGPGMSGVGDGADSAATKMDRATKSMADSIQRATASMDTGAKGSAQYYAALANQRGLNVAALKPYLEQLDMATRKTELAAQAQRKLDESTRFLESLKSRTEGIGKTAAELAEMRAAQLGVSESAAPMIAKMRESEKGAGGMLAAFTPLRVAMVALAAVAAGGALLGKTVMESVDAAASMHDLSIQTGASVAALMEFKRIGETSDTAVDTVAGAMNKLAKGMAVSNEESKGLGQALKAIGLNFGDIEKLSPEDKMIAIAKALDNFRDGAGKSAVAMTLFGKEGAKLLPFLGDIAAESDNLGKSLTEQEKAAKKALAAMADNFGDNLTLIKQSGAAMKKEISFGMLPGLYEASQAFLDVTTEAGGLKDIVKGLSDDGSIARWTRAGVTAITYLLDCFQYLGRVVMSVQDLMGASLAATGTSLSGAASAAMQFLHGDFKQSLETARATSQSVANIGKSFASDLSDTFSGDTFGSKLRARIGEIQKVGVEVAKAKKGVDYDGNSDGGAAAAAAARKKEAESFTSLTAAIQAKTEQNRLELITGQDATESQKLQIKFDEELRAGKLKLAPAHKEQVQTMLDQLSVSEQLVRSQLGERESVAWMQQSAQARNAANATLATEYQLYGQSTDARDIAMVAVKAEADLEKFLGDERRKGIEISEEYRAQLEAERDMYVEVAQAALAQTKALGYSNQLKEESKKFGLQYLADDKARAAAQLSLDAEVWAQRIKNAGDGTLAQQMLQQNFDTWYANESAKPFLDEQKKTWDGIESAAHDTFLSIENGSKSAGERAKQALKNGLFEWLWQLAAKPIYLDVRAAFTSAGASVAGLGDGASAATGAVGIDPLAGAARTASSLYSAVTGGMTLSGGLGSGFMGSLAGGLNGAGVGSGLTSSLGLSIGNGILDVVGPGISGALASGMGAIATALPWVGGALAVVSLGKAAFGHGDTEVAGQGIKGTLSASNLTGSSYQQLHQDGGWFSSDRDWTKSTDFTDAMVAQYTRGLAALESAATGFAASLGVSADSIADYSKTFDLKLTGDQTKDQQVIADFFTGIGDELATKLVPNLDTFAKSGEALSATLERLAGDFKGTDQVAQLLGSSADKLFGSTGLESAAAREQLIDMAGGLSALNTQAAFFNQTFLTDAERIAPVAAALDKALASLGLDTIPTTRDEFKALVNSLIDGGAAATASGAKQLDSLLALGEAFAQVHSAAESIGDLLNLQAQTYDALGDKVGAATVLEKQRALALQNLSPAMAAATKELWAAQAAADAISKAQNKASGLINSVDAALSSLQSVVTREKTAIQTSIDVHTASVTKLQSLSQSLHSTLDSLKSPDQKLADRALGQAQIRAALAIAKAGGPLPDADSLKSALSAVTQDASSQFSSYTDYLRDLYQTQNDITSLAGVTDDSLSVEEKSLDVLNAQVKQFDLMVSSAQAQVDILKGSSTTLLSISQALSGFSLALVGAQNDPINAATAGIANAYQTSLGRTPDAAGMEYWTAQATAGQSLSSIVQSIGGSMEAQIGSLYKELFNGRAADAAGLNYWVGTGSSIDTIRAQMMQSDEYKKLHGIPGFATGGMFGGGLRIVGENGPELEATGPSRIWSSNQTAALLAGAGGGGNTAALEAAVARLIREVEGLRTEARAIAGHTEKTSRITRALRGDELALVSATEDE